MQDSYQVLVASKPELLNEGKGDLWDTGRVISAESTQIEYGGKPLKAEENCYWKVRVWDSHGVVSTWSSIQKWQMGLLSSAAWRTSRWIGARSEDKSLAAPYLRKDFTLNQQPIQATLYASGLGYADLHLNGRAVAPGTERDTGYTNFDKTVLYSAYNITDQVHLGKNVLGTVLGTGWYDVHDKATWNFDRAPWRGRPRLRVLLALRYADGSREYVPSDSTWRTTSGGLLTDGIYTGETYDARLEPKGWDTAEVKAEAWPEAVIMSAPKGKLVARGCGPVTIGETISAKTISSPKPGVYVFDFGQNFAGHVRVHLKAPAGTKIRIRYSERLDKDGMIERSQIEQFMAKSDPPQPFQSDTYICSGNGTETWEQRFSYSGFRYAEVTGLPYKPKLSNFEGRFAHTAFEKGGEFSCSNELFNKIQRATIYSYYSNAQSIPTDCPQREKNGWTGDAQLAAEAGLMNFRSSTFYEKWLNDLSDTESADGQMSVIVPTGGWGRGARHPAWDSAFPIVADDLYRYRNDRRALATHFDGLKTYLDSLAKELKDGALTFDSLGDWLPWQTETPSTFTSTIYLLEDARILAKAASILGHADDQKRYSQLASTVFAGIQKHFCDMGPGIYANSSQTAQAMAIYFNAVPPELRSAAFANLVKNVETQGHIDTGILGAKYLLRVLSDGGRGDLAYKLVNRKEVPGWGYWIEQGATTLWEDWKGESSLNHIMFGDVSNWFYQWITGIRPLESSPGFSKFLISPEPVGDLNWAKAWVESPHGRIRSEWRKSASGFDLEVTIPANTTAMIGIPGHGTLREGGKVATVGNGVHSIHGEGGIFFLEVGSGKYSFHTDSATVRYPKS